MIEDPKKIKKGPPKHDPTCYQLLGDFVIPAGTILRAVGDNKFSASLGLNGEFILLVAPGITPEGFKRVIA